MDFLDPMSYPSEPGRENIVTKWDDLVNVGTIADNEEFVGLSPAKFRVIVDRATVSLEIDYQGYNGYWENVNDCISINGDNLSRVAQERWRARIKEMIKEVAEAGGE